MLGNRPVHLFALAVKLRLKFTNVDNFFLSTCIMQVHILITEALIKSRN